MRAYVITVAGAGGKTTYLITRARALRARGLKVCLTTTTHMWAPAKGVFDYEGLTVVGRPEENGKLAAPDEETFQRLLAEYDAVLVEGDGAHCMPVKIPGEHEPVIPEVCDEIVVVMGKHAIGRKLGTVCHRYERKKFPADAVVTEEVLEEIATEYYIEPLRKRFPQTKITYVLSDMFSAAKDSDVRKTALVIMASGFGRRYGSNKLVEETGGKKLYRHTLEHVLEAAETSWQMPAEIPGQCPAAGLHEASSDVGRISGRTETHREENGTEDRNVHEFETILVTQYEEIIDEIASMNVDVKTIFNPDAEEGIAASIRLGTQAALDGGCDAVIFFAADMPFLPAEEIRRFTEQFVASGRTFSCMEYGAAHVMTNPGALRLKRRMPDGRTVAEHLLSLRGDRGAMRILKAAPQQIHHYQVEEEYVRDIDLKGDLRQLKQKLPVSSDAAQ